MEDPTIRNSKKRLFEECSSSSFFDPDIIEIPPPAYWTPKSSKKKSIVVDDKDDDDDVVIIGENVAPNSKGKKPIIYPAEHEVITLDDLPSPRAESVKGKSKAPRIKHIRFKPKHSSFWDPGTSSHAQTNGLVQPLHLGPKGSAHKQIAPSTSSSPYNPSILENTASSAVHDKNNHSIADGIAAEISPSSADAQSNSGQDSILKKLELFKKFDTLEDHLGHLFEKTKETTKPAKKWVNRIADEWRMLEKDLPDTIFVRVYEARMDLLRAVILGADGTPYHDGLFFFDVHFTNAYPNSPPHVTYHAHGLRINPNLYACGKVCLSLLGTWSGQGDEKWRPGKSNMLQVLVSIQGLVLNAEPYYNEPGYAHSKSAKHRNPSAKAYSENAFILSLKTMIYTLKNPPKYFEDLVYGHFYNRAHDILAACRAYMDGVEVGSYVKGKTVTAKGKKKTCSQVLKASLPSNIKALVEAFTKIGVKDCEKYLVPVNQ